MKDRTSTVFTFRKGPLWAIVRPRGRRLADVLAGNVLTRGDVVELPAGIGWAEAAARRGMETRLHPLELLMAYDRRSDTFHLSPGPRVAACPPGPRESAGSLLLRLSRLQEAEFGDESEAVDGFQFGATA